MNTPSSPSAQGAKPVVCTRCQIGKHYLGTKKFHEGPRYGFLGELGELFVNKETFDIYACPRCGSVEFFVDGVGEGLRAPARRPS